ncbi:ABC transporter [Ramlibacter sp. G-1-2-2]|uniref:ABC transporter n=1 Tax=Ramlibacter agri TaxID=2728837 RepID=A0A848H9Q3_9BURK|nr:ABC-type transport auxiliary lipoprotein family protein [Ramlibacter agri]NML44358.1 ABC transporter [Ramlibacter agri]
MTPRRALLLACLAVPGCAIVAPPERATATSLLDEQPTDLPQGRRRAQPLLVYEPQTRPMYDTTQMAYTVRAHQVAYFSRNLWGETPSQMLHPLLLRSLERTQAFAAVLAPPYTGGGALALHTEVAELVQDFTDDAVPVLRLALRVRLVDETSGKILGTRDIAQQVRMQQKAPSAGVLAANQAVALALREVAAFVLETAP